MATSPEQRPEASSTAAARSREQPPGPPAALPVRLELWPPQDDAYAEGAWWPRSRDLHTEAAHLVDSFPIVHGRVTRLLFSRPDWDSSMRHGRSAWTIRTARGPVMVGSFPSDDTQLIIVSTGHGRRLALVVIPSDTPPLEAHRHLHGSPPRSSPTTPARDDSGDWARWDDESPSW